VYSVNPSTGAVTFLFATKLSAGYTGSVAFPWNDPTDLYAILGNFSTPQNHRFDLKLNTQSVIDMGVINNLDDGSGDFFPVTGLTSVPEPATEVLVGGALVLLALAGRRTILKK
jgi:hypothetical protein